MDLTAEDMKEGQAAKSRNSLHVAFRREATLDEQKTDTAGFPVFTDRVMVRKMVPGDQTSIIDTYAIIDKRHPNADNNLFPAEYAQFLSGDAEVKGGVPLTEFTALVDSQRKQLLYLGFRTVQQIAEASDENLRDVPGGLALRRKAGDFLKARADSAHVLRMSADLEKSQAKEKAVQDELVTMRAALEALQAEKSEKSPEKKKA